MGYFFDLARAVTNRINPAQLYVWLTNASPIIDDLPFVTFKPSGGADDWVKFNALMAANAYKRPILLLPGMYQVKTRGTVPSGTTIIGGPGVIINQTLPTAPYSPKDAAFGAVATTLTGTTLTANAAAGATTLSLLADVAPPIAGQEVFIFVTPSHLGPNAGLRSLIYRVISVAGVGPFTYTIDRPIRNALLINDAVAAIVPPRDIVIDGCGMRMQGTGQRFVELGQAVRCHVSNIDGFAEGGDICFSFDVGSLECTFESIYADGGGALTSCCIALESAERCKLIGCIARNAGAGASLALFDAIDCQVVDCEGEGSARGLLLTSDGNAIGCQSCLVSGGDFSGNTMGLLVDVAAEQTKVSNTSANYNSSTGFNVGNGTVTKGTYFDNCEARFNASHGLRVGAGSLDTFLENCDLSDNVGDVASFGSNATLTNCRGFIGAAAVGIFSFDVAAYTVRLTNCDLNCTTLGINNVQPGNGVKLHIEGCEIGCSSTGIVPGGGSVLHIGRSRVYTNGPAIDGIFVNGGTARLGTDVTSSINFSSGFLNRNTVVANQAVAVPVAWSDLKSTDDVLLTMHTKGGTPSAMPAIAKTPGVGFSLTSYAGDTSTYDYVIL